MKKIILIDDDSTSNYLTELIISSVTKEFEIISFTNPIEMLQQINKLKINKDTIIILDLNMPEIDGWEFINSFNHTRLNCDFCILTSSTSVIEKENAKKHQQVKYVFTKPLTKKDAELFLNKTYQSEIS
jgi:CheY-like chemotaxis protein